MTAKYSWPDSVTTLVADDICKGKISKRGRRCLYGWILDSFSDQKVHASFEETLIKNAISAGSKPSCSDSIIAHNDLGGLTCEELAEVWNQSLRDRGYDA